MIPQTKEARLRWGSYLPCIESPTILHSLDGKPLFPKHRSTSIIVSLCVACVFCGAFMSLFACDVSVYIRRHLSQVS